MLKITCANCNASLQVPPNLAGKKITCPKCKKPTLAAMAPVAIEPEEIEPELEEIVDEDEAFTPVPVKSVPKPAAKSPAKPAAKAPAKPAAKQKATAKPPAKRSSRDEDDDEDFDDYEDADLDMEESEEPASSKKGLWIGLGVGGGVLGLALAGVAFWMMSAQPKPPADPFAELAKKIEAEAKANGFKIEPGKIPEIPADVIAKGNVPVPPVVDPKTPVQPDVSAPPPAPNPEPTPEPKPTPSPPSPKEKVDTTDVTPKPSPPPVVTPKTPPVETKIPTMPPVEKSPKKTPPVEVAKIPTKTPAEKTPPPPASVGDKVTVADLHFETVKVDAKDVLRSLTWAADGKSFYCLQSTGKLQRFSNDDLTAFADADLGERCNGMALSSEGLLVAAPGGETVFVVDPTTLAVRRKVSIPGLDRIAAGAKAPLAVALNKGGEVILFDPKAAKIVQKQTVKDLVPDTDNFLLAAMTPDGKYLFAEARTGKLHRLHVVDQTLVYEQGTAHIASKTGRIDISPDGNHVCLSSETGNSETGLRTFIYPVEDLTTPDVILNPGPTPRAVGFDSNRGTIYAQSLKYALIAFSKSGAKIQPYELPGVGETRQITCSRTGELLVLTDDRLFRARREVK
jgi:cytoskeletal protein RodZ